VLRRALAESEARASQEASRLAGERRAAQLARSEALQAKHEADEARARARQAEQAAAEAERTLGGRAADAAKYAARAR